MKDLIARLEAEEVGNAELDYLIDEFFSDWKNIGGGWAAHKVTGERVKNSFSYPDSVTTSLDAALALADSVLPDWWVELRRYSDGWYVKIAPHSSKAADAFQGSQKPAPLALCIAILKAKLAEEPIKG